MSLPTAYRPCVGMMVINDDNLVLVGQRIDSKEDAWQMPQGGVDEGEDVYKAALRELAEEIGTNNVTKIAESKEWLSYDLPESLVPHLWNGKYRGQTQKWFLFRIHNEDDINIQTPEPEFKATQWVKPEELPNLIVHFKYELYQQVVAEFLPYLK